MSGNWVEIQSLAGRDDAAWNAYVEMHPAGTPFHLTQWRDAVELTFGHEPWYLFAKRAGRIRGVLPLIHVETGLFGSMLVSVPFAVYGGALADDEETAVKLEREAVDLAGRLKVSYLEFRDREDHRHREGGCRELYFTFRRPLPRTPEEVLPSIPRKTRRMVRLGIDAGLRGRLTRSSSSVDAFYRLFAHNLRKLGTPAFPKSLLENLLQSFGDRANILMVEEAGKPVSGVLNLYFRDEVLPYYSGTNEERNAVGVNNFLYYDLMVKSVERGCLIFDFGRSKLDTGPYHFKRHFGFEPAPLPYRDVLVGARELPNLNPTNPRYRRAIELWKRLPLCVTTTVGPWIVRGIP